MLGYKIYMMVKINLPVMLSAILAEIRVSSTATKATFIEPVTT